MLVKLRRALSMLMLLPLLMATGCVTQVENTGNALVESTPAIKTEMVIATSQPEPSPTPIAERELLALPLNPHYEGVILSMPDDYVEDELTGPWALEGTPEEFDLKVLADRIWQGREYVPIDMWPSEEAYALYESADEAVDAIGHNEVLTNIMLNKNALSFYWIDYGAIQPATFDTPASEDEDEALRLATEQINEWFGTDAFTRNLVLAEKTSALKSKDKYDGVGTPIRAYEFWWEPESAKVFSVDGPNGSGYLYARYTGDGVVSLQLMDWTEYAPVTNMPAYDTLTAEEALYSLNYWLGYHSGERITYDQIEGVKSVRAAYSNQFGGITRAWEFTLALRDEGGKAPMYPTNEFTMMVDMRTGRVADPGEEAFMAYDGLFRTPFLNMNAALDTGDDALQLTWTGDAVEIPALQTWEYRTLNSDALDAEVIASYFFEGKSTVVKKTGARVEVILPANKNTRGRFKETMTGENGGSTNISYNIDRNEHVPKRTPLTLPLEELQKQISGIIDHAFGSEFVRHPRPLTPLYDTADGGKIVDDVYFFTWDQTLEGIPVRYHRILAEVTNAGIESLSATWDEFEALPGGKPEGLLSFEQALACLNYARGVLNQGAPHTSLRDYDEISEVRIEYASTFASNEVVRPVYTFTLRKSTSMIEFPVLIDPVSGDCFAEEAGILPSPFRLW